MIYRFITQGLLDTIGYFPVTGIIGPRQVGKTTLAKVIMKSVKKESLYLDLENPMDMAKLTDPVLFFERYKDKCIFLDEIQRDRTLFPILRSMVDSNRVPSRFVLLGSATPDLIRDASESLAGRIAYEELTPFNLLEVGDEKLLHHWLCGGFPDSFLAPDPSLSRKWIFNFMQTYIQRDLPMLGLSSDVDTTRKLWTMIAHIHGNVMNLSNIGKSLELSSTTIKKYLGFFENAFLIRQLQSYSVNVKKRLVKAPKVYIRDSGILHNLLNIADFSTLESHPVLGHSWEGYVIEQIIQKLDDASSCYYYRTHEGAECDLVITKGGRAALAVEVKYTSSPKINRGLSLALADIKAEHNFIVTPGTDEYHIRKDILVCSLSTFLQKYI